MNLRDAIPPDDLCFARLACDRLLKNLQGTASVGMSAFDKEVGMAIRTRGHVIMLVTTGRFSETVRQAARDLARDTNLQAVLLDAEALARYRTGGMSVLAEILRAQARGVMALKREQVPPKLDE